MSVADAGSDEALSRQAFGVPLDEVEFAEMQRRQSMLEAQVDLGTRAEALDGFAGVFIDQPAGGVWSAPRNPDSGSCYDSLKGLGLWVRGVRSLL